MDIDTIPPGSDFIDVIEQALAGCDLVVALIGPSWLSVRDRRRRRRLEQPDDFVRLEIEGALQRRIPVLPVLVGGAEMPSAHELPGSLSALARRHAYELSDRRWRSDIEGLIDAMNKAPWGPPRPTPVTAEQKNALEPSAANGPQPALQTCAAVNVGTCAASGRRDRNATGAGMADRRAAIAGAAVLALAGVGVGAALAFAGARHTTPAPPRASNVVATLTPLATPSVAPGSALTSAVLTQSDLGASGAMLHEVSCSFGSPVDSGHGFLASACRNFNDSTGVAWLNIQAGVFDAPADAHQQYLALKNVSTATSAYTIGDEAFAQSACTATSCSRYAVSWRHGPVLIVMSFATFSGSVLPAITPSDVAALVQMQDAKLGAVST